MYWELLLFGMAIVMFVALGVGLFTMARAFWRLVTGYTPPTWEVREACPVCDGPLRSDGEPGSELPPGRALDGVREHCSACGWDAQASPLDRQWRIGWRLIQRATDAGRLNGEQAQLFATALQQTLSPTAARRRPAAAGKSRASKAIVGESGAGQSVAGPSAIAQAAEAGSPAAMFTAGSPSPVLSPLRSPGNLHDAPLEAELLDAELVEDEPAGASTPTPAPAAGPGVAAHHAPQSPRDGSSVAPSSVHERGERYRRARQQAAVAGAVTGAAAIAATEPQPAPEPAEPAPSWTETLVAFMEARNIRWGEIVGGLLIVSCSLALLVSFWSEIAQRPWLKFGVFTAITSTMFALGLYVDKHWKLPHTSQTLLTIGLLLVPLNFLSMASSNTAALAAASSLDPIWTWAGPLVSLVIFGVLITWSASRLVLVGGHGLTAGVLVPCALQFLAAKAEWVNVGAPNILTVFGLWLAAYVATSVGAWWAVRAANTERDIWDRYYSWSMGAFAVLVVLIWAAQRSGLGWTVARELSGFAPWLILPLAILGLWAWQQPATPLSANLKLAIGLSGAFGMCVLLAGLALAWPVPWRLSWALVNLIGLILGVAWALRMPAVLAGVVPLLGLTTVLVAGVVRGKYLWSNPYAEPLIWHLLSSEASLWSLPFFGMAAVGTWRFSTSSNIPALRAWRSVAAAIAICGILLATGHGWRENDFVGQSSFVYTFYAVAAFVAARGAARGQLPGSYRRGAEWAAAGLSLAALLQTLVFVVPGTWRLAHPSVLALLLHASLWLIYHWLADDDATAEDRAAADSASSPAESVVLTTSTPITPALFAMILSLTVATIGGVVNFAMYSNLASVGHLAWGQGLLAFISVKRRQRWLLDAVVGCSFLLVLALLHTRLMDLAWYHNPSYTLHIVAIYGLAVSLMASSYQWMGALLPNQGPSTLDTTTESKGETSGSRWIMNSVGLRLLDSGHVVTQLGSLATVFLVMLFIYRALPGVAQELAVSVGQGSRLADGSRLAPEISDFLWQDWQNQATSFLHCWTWLLCAAAGAVVRAWRRRTVTWAEWGAYVLAGTLLLASYAEPDRAVASAWRWISAVVLLLGTFAVTALRWSPREQASEQTNTPQRLDLRGLVHSLLANSAWPYLALLSFVLSIGVREILHQPGILYILVGALAGLLISITAGSAFTWRAARLATAGSQASGVGDAARSAPPGPSTGVTYPRAAMVATSASSAIVISILTWGLLTALQATPIAGPLVSSVWGRMGEAVNYAVPLLMLAVGLVVNGITCRYPALTFLGGLLLNVATTIAVMRALVGEPANAVYWIRVLQWNVIASALVYGAWQAFSRQLGSLFAAAQVWQRVVMQTLGGLAAILLHWAVWEEVDGSSTTIQLSDFWGLSLPVLVTAVQLWPPRTAAAWRVADEPAGRHEPLQAWFASVGFYLSGLIGWWSWNRYGEVTGFTWASSALVFNAIGLAIANGLWLWPDVVERMQSWYRSGPSFPTGSLLPSSTEDVSAVALSEHGVSQCIVGGPSAHPCPGGNWGTVVAHLFLWAAMVFTTTWVMHARTHELLGCLSYATIVVAWLLLSLSTQRVRTLVWAVLVTQLGVAFCAMPLLLDWLPDHILPEPQTFFLLQVAALTAGIPVWLATQSLFLGRWIMIVDEVHSAEPPQRKQRFWVATGERQRWLISLLGFAALLMCLLTFWGSLRTLFEPSRMTRTNWAAGLALAGGVVAAVSMSRRRWQPAVLFCLYVLGWTGLSLLLVIPSFRGEIFVCGMLVLLSNYSLVITYLASRLELWRPLLSRLGFPPYGPLATLRSTWFVRWTMFLNSIVALWTAAMLLWTSDVETRIVCAHSLVGASVTCGLLSVFPSQFDLRLTSLVFGIVAAMHLAIAPIAPQTPQAWLSWLLASSVAAMLVTAGLQGVMRGIPQLTPRWRESLARASRVGMTIAIVWVAASLVGELAVWQQRDLVQVSLPLAVAFAAVLTTWCLLMISAAIRMVPNPAQLAFEQRGQYVYVAEVLLAAALGHLRLTVPQLFHPLLSQFWPLIVLCLGFVGVGVSEALRRTEHRTLADPLAKSGAFLPVLPVIGFWFIPSQVDLAWSALGACLLYIGLATQRRSPLLGIAGALMGNVAMWRVLSRADGLNFFEHPQLWLIPPALCVLVLSQLYRSHLNREQISLLRYGALATVYLSSTGEIFLQGMRNAPWLPFVLMCLSVSGVLLGIWIRARSFLYTGTLFLIFSLACMIWYAAVDLQQTWVWYVSGIILGVVIIAVFALFERQREKMKAWAGTVESWQE